MIEIKHDVWDGIPLLICTKKDHSNTPLPTATYLHGMTGAKEDNLSIGYLLAEQGFRVILPDAHLHGERESKVDDHVELKFFDIIQNSIKELDVIYKRLNQDRLIKNGSFTLAGTSMGGITTAAALTTYPWISQAGIMMGTALFHRFSESMIQQVEERGVELPLSKQELIDLLAGLKAYDLSLNIDRLQNRPLFIWHGEEDDVVPYQHAEAFYNQLQKEEADPNSITFVAEEKAGHKVSRQARLALVDWMQKVNQQTNPTR